MRWVFLCVALLGCTEPARSLHQAARQEVYTTASCPSIEVSHVPVTEVAIRRDDVYVAEGCGERWRMTCGEELVKVCPRRHRRGPCHEELHWACNDIQPEADATDDELRTRVTHHDEDMNVLGT